MRTLVFTVLFIFVAGIAFAADIDGNWEGEVQGMDGNPTRIYYTFKANGETLTGTHKNPMDGSDVAVQEGKIDGNNFSFSLDFGMGQPWKFKGTVKGDTMEMKMEMGDMGGGMPEPPPTILTKVE